jgi:radical SAM superfamily enzyme YgiQ (UPF0313 family)
MRILLTHAYFLCEDEKEREIMKPYPPLGLLYVSAYLEQAGFEHEVFDTTFSCFAALQEYLLEYRPRLLGVYVNLMTRINVLRLIRYVKERPQLAHTRIILGGPEVRHHCENFLDYGADIIVLGEGEQHRGENLARRSRRPASAQPEKNRYAGLFRSLAGETRLRRDFHQYHAGLPVRLQMVQPGGVWTNLPPPKPGACGGKHGPAPVAIRF